MSGGVDSSVAAALLVEQGYQVIGMMMRLWSEEGREATNRCCTPEAMALARRVAAQLAIPFYAIDAQQPFRNTVVKYFIEGYTQGITPNPCLVCNFEIRWGFLLERALALGASHMSTGHYVQIRRRENDCFRIYKAVDQAKDQSYVLHILNQDQLSRAIFPLGGLTKSDVRQKARELSLPVAERDESQDLCFLAGGSYRDFLGRNAPNTEYPGPIRTMDGQEIGQHRGLAYYTIGQRKGLGVAASQPLYVLSKDTKNNILFVGPVEEMGADRLVAGRVNWIAGSTPSDEFRAQVKIRYTAQPADAFVTPMDDTHWAVRFDLKQRDITPGQAAVFYVDDECLGGGIIESAE
jgi:tRNA-specific 2-thiouridylase